MVLKGGPKPRASRAMPKVLREKVAQLDASGAPRPSVAGGPNRGPRASSRSMSAQEINHAPPNRTSALGMLQAGRSARMRTSIDNESLFGPPTAILRERDQDVEMVPGSRGLLGVRYIAPTAVNSNPVDVVSQARARDVPIAHQMRAAPSFSDMQ